jgi:hypothetical protein
MTTPFLQPGEHLQRIRRQYTEEFTDQHGRRFAGWYEIANARPIGELQCVSHTPPWLPPMNKIQWERDGSFRFRWDYDSLAAEFAQGSEQFYTEVMEFMIEHMPGEEPPEVDEPIPRKARRLFKPPLSAAIPLACQAGDPWILGVRGAAVNVQLKELLSQSVNANGREAVKLIRERLRTKFAEAGTALVETIPAEVSAYAAAARSIDSVDVKTITHISYTDFIGAAMKDKAMTMAEAALAWKAHRENLALEGAA